MTHIDLGGARMKKKCFFVVGDKFNAFAEGKDVITLNQLKTLSDLPQGLMSSDAVMVLGQGVHEGEVRCILQRYENGDEIVPFLDTSDLHRVLDRASGDISHKKVAYNTLIGAPRRSADDVFELPLNIDERCELMGDHQSGQHVQGMILVEAFRQSFLAVTDAFFPFGDEARYFVINVMNTEFQSFLFPLPAHVEYRILEADVNARRARYKVSMSALQNDIECASAEVTFSVYSASTISEKEAQLAHSVTSAMLASHQTTLALPSTAQNGHGVTA